MTDAPAIVDRFEIEAPRDEFAEAEMMRHYGRFAVQTGERGRMPRINREFLGRGEIRAAIERL